MANKETNSVPANAERGVRLKRKSNESKKDSISADDKAELKTAGNDISLVENSLIPAETQKSGNEEDTKVKDKGSVDEPVPVTKNENPKESASTAPPDEEKPSIELKNKNVEDPKQEKTPEVVEKREKYEENPTKTESTTDPIPPPKNENIEKSEEPASVADPGEGKPSVELRDNDEKGKTADPDRLRSSPTKENANKTEEMPPDQGNGELLEKEKTIVNPENRERFEEISQKAPEELDGPFPYPKKENIENPKKSAAMTYPNDDKPSIELNNENEQGKTADSAYQPSAATKDDINKTEEMSHNEAQLGAGEDLENDKIIKSPEKREGLKESSKKSESLSVFDEPVPFTKNEKIASPTEHTDMTNPSEGEPSFESKNKDEQGNMMEPDRPQSAPTKDVLYTNIIHKMDEMPAQGDTEDMEKAKAFDSVEKSDGFEETPQKASSVIGQAEGISSSDNSEKNTPASVPVFQDQNVPVADDMPQNQSNLNESPTSAPIMEKEELINEQKENVDSDLKLKSVPTNANEDTPVPVMIGNSGNVKQNVGTSNEASTGTEKSEAETTKEPKEDKAPVEMQDNLDVNNYHENSPETTGVSGKKGSDSNDSLEIVLERTRGSENLKIEEQKRRVRSGPVFLIKEDSDGYAVRWAKKRKILAFKVGSRITSRFSTVLVETVEQLEKASVTRPSIISELIHPTAGAKGSILSTYFAEMMAKHDDTFVRDTVSRQGTPNDDVREKSPEYNFFVKDHFSPGNEGLGGVVPTR